MMGGFAGGRHDRGGTMEQILEPTNDLAWILESEGYDQLRQSSLDSRFAISNGFQGVKGGRVTTRGARSIPPCESMSPGCSTWEESTMRCQGLFQPRTGCRSGSCWLAHQL